MSLEPDGTARPALRVGYVPGVTLTRWRRVWAERLPQATLEVVELPQAGQRQALEAGRVDVSFVRLPVERDGLHLIRLYDEVAVVVAPKDHPVAAFDHLTLSDLAGEPRVPDGPDAFDRVAWGAGVLVVPHSVARSKSRRDLIAVPLTDVEPTTIGLAWLVTAPASRVTDEGVARGREELIEEFVGIVRGRTANSSRTAAARAKQEPATPKARRPAPTRKTAAHHGARRRRPRSS